MNRLGVKFRHSLHVMSCMPLTHGVALRSGHHLGVLTGELSVVVCLGFCWRDIPDGFEQAMVVEPEHPLQRSELDGLPGFPGCPAVNQLGLVQTVDGLGQATYNQSCQVEM